MATGRRLEILMVEDNAGDVWLAREAMKDWDAPNRLHVVTDGVQAMDFLNRRPPFGEAPRPDLILLDLNLPRMSGKEVLESVKSDPEFRRIPVIILTTSKAQSDIVESYDLHANAYIAKPVDLDKFYEATRSLQEFWFQVAKLPPG